MPNENIKKNIDNVIAQSLAGDGPLTGYLDNVYNGIYDKIEKAQASKLRRNPGMPPMLPEQMKAQADAEFQKTVNEKLKPALEKAAAGETRKVDIQEVAGLASAAGNVASSIGSGSILGLLTSIPSLISNSIVGDYFNAAISYFFGGENKPKSFGEAVERVRFERGIASISEGLGADAGTLKAALLRDPAEYAAANQAAAAQAAQEAAAAAAQTQKITSESPPAVAVQPDAALAKVPAADGTVKAKIVVGNVFSDESSISPDVPDAAKTADKKGAKDKEPPTVRRGGANGQDTGLGEPIIETGGFASVSPKRVSSVEDVNPDAAGVRNPEKDQQKQAEMASIPLADVVMDKRRFMDTFSVVQDPYFDQPNGVPPEGGSNLRGAPRAPIAKGGPDFA